MAKIESARFVPVAAIKMLVTEWRLGSRRPGKVMITPISLILDIFVVLYSEGA
jgi:hypothetical protein